MKMFLFVDNVVGLAQRDQLNKQLINCGIKILLAIAVITPIILYRVTQLNPVEVRVTGKTPQGSFVISMPQRDKDHLELFFRHFCLFEQWAYTLARVKPVTTSVCKKQSNIWGDLSVKNRRLTGWKTWLKYSHYFQNSDFLVFTDKCPTFDDLMLITIIDKVQLNTIVEQYLSDFYSVLQIQNLTGDELIKNVSSQSFLQDILKNHDGLIGTVLGYGRNNAWQYHAWKTENENQPLEMLWDKDLMEKMLVHWKAKKYFAPWDLTHLFYPTCTANTNSEESMALREKYERTREKIVAYYNDRDFVEATLSLIAGHEL